MDAVTQGTRPKPDANKVGGDSERLTFKPFSILKYLGKFSSDQRNDHNQSQTRPEVDGVACDSN